MEWWLPGAGGRGQWEVTNQRVWNFSYATGTHSRDVGYSMAPMDNSTILYMEKNLWGGYIEFKKKKKRSSSIIFFCRGVFPDGSVVKNLPANEEMWVQSVGQADPLEEGMATHSSTLAWRIPWTEEPGGLQSVGSQRVRHDWATKQQQQTLSCTGSVLGGFGSILKYEEKNLNIKIDMAMCLTDSLCCTLETNNVVNQLYSNENCKWIHLKNVKTWQQQRSHDVPGGPADSTPRTAHTRWSAPRRSPASGMCRAFCSHRPQRGLYVKLTHFSVCGNTVQYMQPPATCGFFNLHFN